MKIVGFVMLLLPLIASAAVEPSASSKIKRLITYADYGGGDVQVVLDTNGTTCVHGYYMNKNDPNFDAMHSMLLSAYHAKSEVVLRGHTNLIWPGSANGTYCKLYSVRFEN